MITVKESFEDPKLLVRQARHQIQEILTRTKVFYETHPYTKVIDIDSKTGEEVHKFRLTAEFPDQISAFAKDACGNLRDALDHAVYASAVTLVGGEPSDTGFPFAKNAAGVKGELGGKRLKGNPPEVRTFLESFNPYEGGNSLLWGLNQMRNPNTHRIVTPILAASMVTRAIGENMFVGSTVHGLKFGYSHWDAAKNEVEFLRCRPGYTPDYKVQLSCSICFEQGNIMSGKPVLSSLIEIADEVERVVLAIEAETDRLVRTRGS